MFNECPKHNGATIDTFVNIENQSKDCRLLCEDCFLEVLNNRGNKQDFASMAKLLNDPLSVVNLRQNHNKTIQRFQKIYLELLSVNLEEDVNKLEVNIRKIIDQLLEYLNQRLAHFKKLTEQIKEFNLNIVETPKQLHTNLKSSYQILQNEKKGPQTDEWKRFINNLENFISYSYMDTNDSVQVQYQEIKKQVQNTQNQHYHRYLDDKFSSILQEVNEEINKFQISYCNKINTQLFASVNEQLCPRNRSSTLMASLPLRIKNKEFKLISNKEKSKTLSELLDRVQNVEHILMLMKLNTNNIIGFYIPMQILQKWDPHDETFVFSITKNEVYKTQREKQQYGQVIQINNIPNGGYFNIGPHAIQIANGFQLSGSNFSECDMSHIKLPPKDLKTYLYGQGKAVIVDFEVYCIQ